MSRKNNKSRNNNNNVVNIEQSFRKVRIDDLKTIQAKTDNQQLTFDLYREENNLALHGSAGTGKTFLSIYLALEQVLDPSVKFKKLVIVRSVVPTRDIGFLKGDDKEKISVYEAPYIAICEELFGIKSAYEALKAQGSIEFISTSFIRGSTLNNAIVLVDEFENLNFHELDSVITRIGENTKIIYCGDHSQSDFTKEFERSGILKFMQVLRAMSKFKNVEFTVDDIVRSPLVKEYIMTKTKLGFGN